MKKIIALILLVAGIILAIWNFQNFSLLTEEQTRELDEEAKKRGELPLEHENCKGRRTLSNDNGNFTYGCTDE